MMKVYAVIAVDVNIPAGLKNGTEVVNLMADALESCFKRKNGGYDGMLVRIYEKLEDAMADMNSTNACVFRRAAEGIRGDKGGRDIVEYVREMELL